MLTRLALVIATLIVASPVFAQPKADWIADPKTGCKVWNDDAPQAKESITWTGSCQKGMAQGHGSVQWFEDGKPTEKYEGTYRDGKLQDGNIIYYASGNRYEGEYRAGKFEGHGVFTSANGNRYEGEWRADQRTGHGLFIWPDGSRFEGEFRDGKPNGNGTYIRNGKTFAGIWTNGCFKQGERWAVVDTTKEACGFK